MILLGSKEITQCGKVEPILKFEVVFMTPQGLCDTLEQANDVVDSLEMSPLIIKPMVVAVGASMRELCL